MDAAMVAAIRRLLSEGMKRAEPGGELPPEVVAAAASWAICGAVKQWFSVRDWLPAATFVPQLLGLILPMLAKAESPVEAAAHLR
jgi:hypothetical protein